MSVLNKVNEDPLTPVALRLASQSRLPDQQLNKATQLVGGLQTHLISTSGCAHLGPSGYESSHQALNSLGPTSGMTVHDSVL